MYLAGSSSSFFFLPPCRNRAAGGDEDRVEISSGSFLHLNLNGKLIQERTDDSEFAELLSLVEDAPAAGLNGILRGIDQAASDENISGMVLESAVFMGGGSTAQEIRSALSAFQTAANRSMPTEHSSVRAGCI